MGELSIVEGQVETFEFPDDFIRALHPLDNRWSAGSKNWIFRGHWSSEWKLIPSIYRSTCVDPFLNPGETFEHDYARHGEDHVADIEREILRRAFDEFDDAGLAIPDPMNVRPLLEHTIVDPPGMLIPFMALAQHHGVPTRLLDWTTQAKVAAYFAAADIVKHDGDTNGMLEVIALHKSALELVDARGTPICRLWRAPRASNANLHAQAGVFTVCTGIFVKDPLDELLGAEPKAIRRLRLPQGMARYVLDDLVHEGVTGATMFPGYDGAVRRMKEERFYWEPLPFLKAP